MQLFLHVTHRLVHAHQEFFRHLFWIRLVVSSSWLYFSPLRIEMGKEIEILFTATLTRYLPKLMNSTSSSDSVWNCCIVGGHDSSILLVLMVRGFSFSKFFTLIISGTKFAIVINQLINMSARKHGRGIIINLYSLISFLIRITGP